jgi:sterol desaturase/sphingolipid hydroxylase (fatty acid hydroxylase superfamily)
MITAVAIKFLHAIGFGRFLLTMSVFIVLERLAPHRERKPIFRDGWVTDLLSYLVNGALFVAIIVGWNHLMPQGVTWIRALPAPFNFHDHPAIVQALDIYAIRSFVYYWGHRAEHHFGFLWRFHSVHHSIEQMDWLATYRGHLFDTVYGTVLLSIPIILLDLSMPVAVGYVIYGFFEGQIEHSNVRVPLGPLKWVVPSPWFHHWHHALDADAQNKNFSPYPVWDVIFGTAFMPATRLPARFGVAAPVPKDYLGQLVYPFRLMPVIDRLRRVAATSDKAGPAG